MASSVPWLVATSLQSLLPSSRGLPGCVFSSYVKSPSAFLLYGHLPLDLGPSWVIQDYFIQDSSLTCIYKYLYFPQIRQHSQVSVDIAFGERYHSTYYRGGGQEFDIYFMSLEKPPPGTTRIPLFRRFHFCGATRGPVGTCS